MNKHPAHNTSSSTQHIIQRTTSSSTQHIIQPTTHHPAHNTLSSTQHIIQHTTHYPAHNTSSSTEHIIQPQHMIQPTTHYPAHNTLSSPLVHKFVTKYTWCFWLIIKLTLSLFHAHIKVDWFSHNSKLFIETSPCSLTCPKFHRTYKTSLSLSLSLIWSPMGFASPLWAEAVEI